MSGRPTEERAATIPPLRLVHRDGATWYAADGWLVKVRWSAVPKRVAGRRGKVPLPIYHFHVWRVDAYQRPRGEPLRFSYEPKTWPRSETLPARTATRRVREHVQTAKQEGAER